MGKELIPPRHRPENQMMGYVSGYCSGMQVVIHHPWQSNFYFLLDAFLTATRSVPDVIQKGFGADPGGGFEWKTWHDSLPREELSRRVAFQREFKPLYEIFNKLPASKARKVTLHVTGTPPVEVKITGFWGQEYIGGPRDHIPALESRDLTNVPEEVRLLVANSRAPIEPRADNFSFCIRQADGSTQSFPLFSECRRYVAEADNIIRQGREIARRVHADKPLTEPPG